MSRRKIVVEGTTYHWETNGYSIAIIPPKGTEGGTRRYSVDTEFEVSSLDYDDYERWVAITPRAVASLIYRDILKKPMPERKRMPTPIRHRKPDPVIHWQTSGELPRLFVVEAKAPGADGGYETLALEVHETPATAQAAVERLNGANIRGVVAQALKKAKPPMTTRRGDESHAVVRLVEWLRAVTPPLLDGAAAFTVRASEVPFKVAS